MGTGCSGAGQAVNHARASLEQDANALIGAHRAIDRIQIRKIIGLFDRKVAKLLAGEGRHRGTEECTAVLNVDHGGRLWLTPVRKRAGV